MIDKGEGRAWADLAVYLCGIHTLVRAHERTRVRARRWASKEGVGVVVGVGDEGEGSRARGRFATLLRYSLSCAGESRSGSIDRNSTLTLSLPNFFSASAITDGGHHSLE